jgi:hypothetical protein
MCVGGRWKEVTTMDDRDALMARLNSREALLEALRGLRADIDRAIDQAGEVRMVQPGAFGDLAFKDVIAHLTGWRLVTAARLEAGLRHEEPAHPWPAHLNEDDHTDEINRWFYEQNRDKPVAQVVGESGETFDRCLRAIESLPEGDLLLPHRFPWLGEWRLGPAVVSGTLLHYHEDHEPDIRAWLAKG